MGPGMVRCPIGKRSCERSGRWAWSHLARSGARLSCLPAEVLLELPEGVEVLAGPDQVDRGTHLRLVAAGKRLAHAHHESAAPLGVANVRRRHGRAAYERIAQGDVPATQALIRPGARGCDPARTGRRWLRRA